MPGLHGDMPALQRVGLGGGDDVTYFDFREWDALMDFPRVQRFLRSIPERTPTGVAQDLLFAVRLGCSTPSSVVQGVKEKYRRYITSLSRYGPSPTIDKIQGYIDAFDDNWDEALHAAEYYMVWELYADKGWVKRARAEEVTT